MESFLGFSPLLPFFLLLSSLLSQSSTTSAGLTNLTARDALISIKSSITFDPSGALVSWNQSSRFCQWRGILCDSHGGVFTLDLRDLGLRGTISPSIGNLSASLRFLYLQNNQFSGNLPPQLGDLAHLEALNVSTNLIGGVIPPDVSKCSNLTSLDLSMNQISGRIPAYLGRLSKLQYLNLGRNLLAGVIPATVGNLSSLHTLDLGTNSLAGQIPSDLGRLQNLLVLQISINSLAGLVPSSLYNLSSLKVINLASNDLHGEIPADVGFRLPNLIFFRFCINKFTGRFPPSLHNATKLQNLRMSNNFLSGPVPPGLDNLHDLAMYNIGFNRITSSGVNGLEFVSALTNCSKLEFIGIDGNLLEGVLPASVGNLSKSLSMFYLGGNRISGGIPASIGGLTNLTLLNMSHNFISGGIPPEIGRLKQLRSLSLEENRLSGEIPAAVGNLSELTLLELHGNQLSGSIPTTFGGLHDLLSLDASRNKLEGNIPIELFTVSSLSSVLNLSNNGFTGGLPEEIGDLGNIIAIDLSGNFLSGSIPNSVGGCHSLQTLSLSNNSFSGVIPDAMGSLKALQSLDLSMNELSGSIPEGFAKIKGLQFLNLSFNDLEGDVPGGGIFANRSYAHLEGNRKLCIYTSCKTKSDRIDTVIRVIIFPATALVILCLLGCIVWFFFIRKRANTAKIMATTSLIKGKHPVISYEELRRATDNFDARNLIGAGSFGSVYRGVLRDESKVAVKVLNLEAGGALGSLEAECEALRNARHRNLLKLVTLCLSLDAGNNEFAALVYEFMGNGSLEEWLRGKRRSGGGGGGLSLVQRLGIAIDVASALDYLHNDGEAAVVHCDVKPSNVLLDEHMTAKVGDFGLAKVMAAEKLRGEDSTTTTHRLKGSIGYIPPEYGFGGKPSTKGDVYSYGVMLLELFAGRSPTDECFRGDLSLVRWIEAAFPCQILQVLDDELLSSAASDEQILSLEKREECFVSVMSVGLDCAKESPDARLAIRDVLLRLKRIRDEVLQSHVAIEL